MRVLKVSLAVALFAVLAACGSTSPSGSNGNGNGNGTGNGNGSTCSPASQGTLTATIDGVSYTALCVTATRSTAGGITAVGIGSSNTTTSFGLGFTGSSTGTFTVANGTFNALVQVLSSGAVWTASFVTANSSGSVTMTRNDATGAAGTFLFTAVASQGSASGTKTVTNGSFSVTF